MVRRDAHAVTMLEDKVGLGKDWGGPLTVPHKCRFTANHGHVAAWGRFLPFGHEDVAMLAVRTTTGVANPEPRLLANRTVMLSPPFSSPLPGVKW